MLVIGASLPTFPFNFFFSKIDQLLKWIRKLFSKPLWIVNNFLGKTDFRSTLHHLVLWYIKWAFLKCKWTKFFARKHICHYVMLSTACWCLAWIVSSTECKNGTTMQGEKKWKVAKVIANLSTWWFLWTSDGHPPSWLTVIYCRWQLIRALIKFSAGYFHSTLIDTDKRYPLRSLRSFEC